MRGKEGNSPARGLENCAPIDASLPSEEEVLLQRVSQE